MTLPGPPSHPKRLVYLGTPEVAVPPLRALHAAGFAIPLVVTRPDKRRGRGKTRSPSPVKAAALELGLDVTDDLSTVADLEVDLGVVVAYGRIIPTSLLEVLPMVNLHFSILPRWRGAAPVERAILAGDQRTGVCLMGVAPELDTGDVHRCDEVDIDPDESLDELRGRLVDLGSELLVEELQRGLEPGVAQTGAATYAAKIEAVEHRLDFSQSAGQLHRVVRLGRAWCEFRGRRLKVLAARPVEEGELGAAAPADQSPPADDLRAADVGRLAGPVVTTGHGRLELVAVQPEGKKPMPVEAWLNGVKPEPGERLG